MTMQALASIGGKAGGAMIAGDDHNKKGYWEASEVVAFHDALLNELGRSWGTPEHIIPVPEDWFSSKAADQAQSKVGAILEERLSGLEDGELLAIKDPRMSLFLPLWVNAATQLSIKPRAIVCLRHPESVARSLQKRDQTSREMCFSMWLTYTVASLAYTQDVPLFLSQYQDWNKDTAGNMKRLSEFVGLETQSTENPFDRGMANSMEAGPTGNSLVDGWWDELSIISHASDLPTELFDRARGHVNSSQQMLSLAAAIRAEVGDTPTFVAKRDLESYRTGFADLLQKHKQLGEERDALAARAIELHDSHESLADLYSKVPRPIRWITRHRKTRR
ncbi:hypothetical protein MUY35_09040 [Aliiroseovarius sp. S1339]|uniref:sulfotransferase family protein n=1 Tax=Aliiroseovarius sp. S1339 TaxID=2936990 RepID=UPI0020C18968|nr:hypothetical protein [Aliiroseovarius sp. S1339]MCK8463993.1 hypothetical protein [Aliiroseovarius sp. S1339]